VSGQLTLAEAARMMRQALRDRSYRATPLGLEVARHYRWKKNEWGATAETLRDYEAILAKLALDHADLELSDFEPPVVRNGCASSSTIAGATGRCGRGRGCEGDLRKMLAAQTRQRDRVALLLLFRLGLRKSELARVQFAHYDGRNLTVFGKGGKVRYLPVVERELRLELERRILDRQPSPGRVLALPGEDRP